MKTQISATGADRAACAATGPARWPWRCGGVRCGGFTLLELIAAIAVAALALGVLSGNYSRLQESLSYRSTVRELASGLASARNLAQRQGREVVFFVDLSSRRYGIDQRETGRLPDHLRLALQIAGQEARSQESGSIRFYPDGSATGGSILVARDSGQGVRLRVDWLFGRISQEPLAG